MKRWTRVATPILAGFSIRKSYFREAVVQHQEHEINVALSGEGVYRVGCREPLTLAAGEILLLPAGLRHGIEVPDRLRMAVIHFHPSVFDGFPSVDGPSKRLLARLRTWEVGLSARKLIASEAHSALERLTEDVVVEQNRQGLGREPILRALASQAAVHFLRLMAMAAPLEGPGQTTQRILTVRHWLDRHFAEPCGVNSLAEMAHLAPTYFAAEFRRVVGQPPMTYVRDRRLEQARMLLERTDEPVKVVAWSVGYSQAGHFNHAFKQATGLTPLAYRKQAAGRHQPA